MLKRDTEVNVKWGILANVLVAASQIGSYIIVTKLLKRGVDVHANVYAGPVSSTAPCAGHLEIVKEFPERGADFYGRRTRNRYA